MLRVAKATVQVDINIFFLHDFFFHGGWDCARKFGGTIPTYPPVFEIEGNTFTIVSSSHNQKKEN